MVAKLMVWVSWALASTSYAARSIDIVAIETGEALEDNVTESHSLKCMFLNPSTKTQNVTFTFYDTPNATNTKITLPSSGTVVTGSPIVLNPNESYSILFCKAKNGSDCEESAIGATPIRLNVSISNNDGYLMGSCVSHMSINANKHRSSAVSVAGGKPF